MSQLVLFLGALIVSWLIFVCLMNVVKTTLSTALTLAALIMLLQVAFGIDIPMLLEAIIALPQTLGDIFNHVFRSQ
jgi:hypothetical protein